MADSEGFDEVDSADHATQALGDALGMLGGDFNVNSLVQSNSGEHVTQMRRGTYDGENSNIGLPVAYTLRSNNAAIDGPQGSWNSWHHEVPGFAFGQQLRSLRQGSPDTIKLHNDHLGRKEHIGDSGGQSDGAAVVNPEQKTLMDCGARPKEKQWASCPGRVYGHGAPASREYANNALPSTHRLSRSELKLQGTELSQRSLLTKLKPYRRPAQDIPHKPSSDSPLSRLDGIKYQSDSFGTSRKTCTEVCENSSGLDTTKMTYDRSLIVSDCLPQNNQRMSPNSSLQSYIEGKLSLLNDKQTSADCWDTCIGLDKNPREKHFENSFISHDECDGRNVNKCKLNYNLHLHLEGENVTADSENNNDGIKRPEPSSNKLCHSHVLSSDSNGDKPFDACETQDHISLNVCDTPNPPRLWTDYNKQPSKKKKVPTATLR